MSSPREPLYGAAAARVREQLRRRTDEQAPGITPGALPPAVTDLLAAVVEALDVPLPSIDDADERAFHKLLDRRATNVRIVLASILDFPDVAIDNDPAAIRAHIASTPVTYGLYEPTPDGGQQ